MKIDIHAKRASYAQQRGASCEFKPERHEQPSNEPRYVLPSSDLDDCDKNQKVETTVTPWEVQGEVDYEKLIRDFGSEPITADMVESLKILTNSRPHHFLSRNIFFSHRDFHRILQAHSSGTPFYLYTGRGPSSEAMHLGHLVPFLFTKWLQDVFDVPLVIQITDDEKYLWKDITMEKMDRIAHENIKDIIALGFNPQKTFIFKNYEYLGSMYRVVSKIQRGVTASQARNCFGFRMEDNIGKWSFPAIQAAPSFAAAFPHLFPMPEKEQRNVLCLIPCAIDQDPYFRLTRDIAPRLGWPKPALLHSIFFPALVGPHTKMSASASHTCIYLTDTPEMIKDKISRYAFSGGGATRREHLTLGGHAEIDVPLQWLRFFMEDENKLAELTWGYRTGRVSTSEVKKVLIEVLQKIVAEHQRARALVTDADVKSFTCVLSNKPKNQGENVTNRTSVNKKCMREKLTKFWTAACLRLSKSKACFRNLI